MNALISILVLPLEFISFSYNEVSYLFSSLSSSLLTIVISYALYMLISYYYSIQYLVLNNKYVVITGADSGLGLESCALLATKGIKIIALTINEIKTTVSNTFHICSTC
jgi:hypothetical protein